MTHLRTFLAVGFIFLSLIGTAQVIPPIQESDKVNCHLQKPERKRLPQVSIQKDDQTPPSKPSLKKLNKYSYFNVDVEFNASTDPESGIDYYAYQIGTTPGGNDLNYGQSVGLDLRTYSESLWTLGFQENKDFYVSIYAVNNEGMQSEMLVIGPLQFVWEELGKPTNKLNFEFAATGLTETGESTETFSASEKSIYTHFINRIIPIIEQFYGPPSHSYTVKLVRDLYYSSSNVFFSGPDEIHIGTGEELIPRLMTHELIHAFRDNVCLSKDSLWEYHPKLSGFEESFAEGMAYKCMNRYVELYPNDMIVHPNGDIRYNSDREGTYDMINNKNLTTEDFSSAGSLLSWRRYQMGAAVILKILVEDEFFAKKFNAKYYSELNSNHQLRNSRELMKNYFAFVVDSVEGKITSDWIERQRILDCKIVPGKKILSLLHYYPYWQWNRIYERIQFFETFPNGSEWYYNGQYHHLNGAMAKYEFLDNKGGVVKTKNFQILPAGQPFTGAGEYNGFATKFFSFTTNDSLSTTLYDPGEELICNLDKFQLYNFKVTIDNITENYPRVIGDTLIAFDGVYGGILNSKGGKLSMKHHLFPETDTMSLVNSAFLKNTAWASVFVPTLSRNYAISGKVAISYRDSTCELYKDNRNVVYGEGNNGHEIFLFDTKDMKHLAFNPIFTVSIASKKATFDEQTLDAENWQWTFGDGNSSTTANPVHTYASNGTYNVCMTASRKEGCKAKTCKAIKIGNTGIEEQELNIVSYPNPVEGIQTIDLGQLVNDVQIQLTDITGKTIFETYNSNTDKVQIDFSAYSKGVYFIHLEVNKQTYTIQTVH